MEPAHEKRGPRTHLRGLRGYQLRETLRNPGLQRLFRIFQTLRAPETHLQVFNKDLFISLKSMQSNKNVKRPPRI